MSKLTQEQIKKLDEIQEQKYLEIKIENFLQDCSPIERDACKDLLQCFSLSQKKNLLDSDKIEIRLAVAMNLCEDMQNGTYTPEQVVHICEKVQTTKILGFEYMWELMKRQEQSQRETLLDRDNVELRQILENDIQDGTYTPEQIVDICGKVQPIISEILFETVQSIAEEQQRNGISIQSIPKEQQGDVISVHSFFKSVSEELFSKKAVIRFLTTIALIALERKIYGLYTTMGEDVPVPDFR